MQKIFLVILTLSFIVSPKLNLLLLTLFAFYLFFKAKFKIIFLNKKIYFSIIIIIFLDLLNLLFTSINKYQTLTEILSWIMIFFLIFILENLRITKIRLTIAIINIGNILSLITILNFIFKENKILNILFIPTTNILTFILITALNLSMLYKNKKISKLIISIAIFILGSRLAIIFLCLTYLIRFCELKKIKKIIGMILLSFVIILNKKKIISIITTFELNTIIDFKNNYSNIVRVNIWKDIIAYLKEENNIFLGIGAGNFYDFYFSIRSINFEARTTHNIILSNYIERGMLGAIWIIYFYIFIMIKCLKDKLPKYITLSWIYYLVYSQVEAGWEDSRLRIIIYLLIFIILKNKKEVCKR